MFLQKSSFYLLFLSGLFTLCSFSVHPDNPPNRAAQLAAIQKVFKQWVSIENEQQYCSKEVCAAFHERAKKGDFSCGMRLSETLDTSFLVWGDINGDGIEDAYLQAAYEQCELGTWFINVAMGGHVLIFLSDGKGAYNLLNQPKPLVDNIGVGYIKVIEQGILYGQGMFFSGEQGLHEVDVFWEVQFQYKNQQFQLLHHSPKIKLSYED